MHSSFLLVFFFFFFFLVHAHIFPSLFLLPLHKSMHLCFYEHGRLCLLFFFSAGTDLLSFFLSRCVCGWLVCMASFFTARTFAHLHVTRVATSQSPSFFVFFFFFSFPSPSCFLFVFVFFFSSFAFQQRVKKKNTHSLSRLESQQSQTSESKNTL